MGPESAALREDPRPLVAEALDRFVPDPDGPYREWRRKFLASLGAARTPMRSTPAEVADWGDDLCVEELRLLVENLTRFYQSVQRERAARSTGNVIPFRGVS